MILQRERAAVVTAIFREAAVTEEMHDARK
jgi:hypothetical protein